MLPDGICVATDPALSSVLRAIPDGRRRRGIRIPAWTLLPVAVLGILSGCPSLRDLERFAIRHHAVLTEAPDLELLRPPSDSAFRPCFRQVDADALCTAIRDWTTVQIPDGAADLDQLIDAGKTLRGSIRPTGGGGSAFIARVTLESAALGLAPGSSSRRLRLRRSLTAISKPAAPAVRTTSGRCAGSGLGRLSWRACCTRRLPCTPRSRLLFRQLQELGADVLVTVRANQATLCRQIRSPHLGKRRIRPEATDQEISHGCDLPWTLRARQATAHNREAWNGTGWIVERQAIGTRDGKRFQACHRLLTSLRTSPEALR